MENPVRARGLIGAAAFIPLMTMILGKPMDEWTISCSLVLVVLSALFEW